MIFIPCRWTEVGLGCIPVFNKTVDLPLLVASDEGISDQRQNSHGVLIYMAITASSPSEMKAKIHDMMKVLFREGVKRGYGLGSFVGCFKEFWEENGQSTNIIGLGYVFEETDWDSMPDGWCENRNLPIKPGFDVFDALNEGPVNDR
jgi:hypothetical protein